MANAEIVHEVDHRRRVLGRGDQRIHGGLAPVGEEHRRALTPGPFDVVDPVIFLIGPRNSWRLITPEA